MSDNGFQISLTIHQDNIKELYEDLVRRSMFVVYGEVDPTYEDHIDLHNVSHRIFPVAIKDESITLYIDILNNEKGRALKDLINNGTGLNIIPKFVTEGEGENEYITQVLTINLITLKDESD